MKLASIEKILEISPHKNADRLSIATVLGYQVIIPKETYKVGDLVVLCLPDSVLPDAPWAAFYKAKSSRIKAVKLRGEWSFGVVESLDKVGYSGLIEEGLDITDAIGVTKYFIPEPQDLSARRLLPWNICKTDETNYQSVRDLPFGEMVDVTLKADGQSWSAYVKLENGVVVDKGVLGRTMEYKLDCDNNYIKNEKQFDVLSKLEKYCLEHNVSLCVRGEQYGQGIQKFDINPHAKKPLSLEFYSVYLIDEMRYARKGDQYYFANLIPKLGLPTVPMVESNVELTSELIAKYKNGETLAGQVFEGVVINHARGSFKVISMYYDSKK